MIAVRGLSAGASGAAAARKVCSSADLRYPCGSCGFSFTTLPAKAAQELRQRGRRGGVTVRFSYRVPNG